MQQLNLPAYEYRLKRAGGKVWIFDGIRKKFVVLTPEEWVRQHLVNYLVNHLKYPKGHIKVETGLRFNTLSKRSDITVVNQDGSTLMVVECKSPTQRITQATAMQVAVYNTSLKAPYVLISNGMQHFCFAADFTTKKVVRVEDIPAYPVSIH